jgi:hypothetical protein
MPVGGNETLMSFQVEFVLEVNPERQHEKTTRK